MTTALWSAIDAYFDRELIGSDPLLESCLEDCASEGLPDHQVSALQGRFLELLVRISKSTRVLEIGTLGGYSAIWMARALPLDGQLVTLECQARHAEVAMRNFQRAGLDSKIELRSGPALASLKHLLIQAVKPFDLVFIDADKVSNAEYLSLVLRLTQIGSVIVADNVVRSGAILEKADDPSVAGVRRFIEAAAGDPRLVSTVIQTVGCKGWDGFAISIVR